MSLTRAVTYIRLADTNPGKLAELDRLADEYIRLCQQYVSAFCSDLSPDKYADAWLASPLSARWQRVVIQHAAGIAQSWRTNRNRSYATFLNDLAEHPSHRASERSEPTWREWRTPVLKTVVIQANANGMIELVRKPCLCYHFHEIAWA